MEDLNEKNQKNLSEFQERIRGKTGERILVVEERQKHYRSFGHGPDRDYNLGVLVGDSYSMGRKDSLPAVCIPAEKHVNFHQDYDRSWNYELEEGPIKIEEYFFCFFGEALNPFLHSYGSSDFGASEIFQQGLLVYLDEEIDSYFFGKRERFLADIHNESLPVIDYVNILRLAGSDVPKSIEGEYSEVYLKEQLKTVSEIDRLEGAISGLEKKLGIKKTRKEDLGMFSRKPVLPDDDFDEVDNVMLTLGDRRKLGEIQGKLYKILKTAVKLGMNKGEKRTLELEPGKTIELPRYILAKMQYHEISI